jgi:tetratricopeptide (TPR) repeat protein/O-antigen ligase
VSDRVPLVDRAAIVLLHVALVWTAVAAGAYRPWPLALAQLLVLGALACWIVSMAGRGRLEWRRTVLDLPLALFALLVVVQLALGNAPLAAWALGPPARDLAAPAALPALWTVGTVSPAQTARSLRLFLTYAAVYVLVVNLVRTRAALEWLVRTLLLLGGVLAFAALLDYLGGHGWLLGWGDIAPKRRLSGTFVNPDHFAAWLEMLICLGIGAVIARSGRSEGAAGAWWDRARREAAIRRYLPMVAVGVMALALVGTLSRGGIISLALALAALLAMQGMAGRARMSLVLVGALLAVTVTYGAFIGLDALIERFRSDPYVSRLVQLRSSLEMLRAFPVVGVGLGAYRDIYFRYQPAELDPGRMYFPFAHNDLVQLAIETGLIGSAICLFAAWRVAADLIGAHVLGRGRCPVGGGEGDGARRRDTASVGIALGALAAVLALVVHSAFDFGARIPADGMLGSACLGIATVALHTRFSGASHRLLTSARALALGSRARRLLVATGSVALAVACVPAIVRAPRVESALTAPSPAAAARVDRALAIDPGDAEARWARARLRLAEARRLWESGETADGRVLTTWPDRRREALPLFDDAVADLTAALSARPSDPYLHDALGWAHANAAAIAAPPASDRQAAAVTGLRRAIALQPANPYLHRSLAALALSQPAPLLPIAIDATRHAIAGDPALLPDLAARFLPLSLRDEDWRGIVPDTTADRLELGALLDTAGLAGAARAQYRRAVEVAPPATEALSRLVLARSLARGGDLTGARAELDAALSRDPDNPELYLARGRVEAARRDAAGALRDLRAAVERAEDRTANPRMASAAFAGGGAREQAFVEQVLGPAPRGVPRYRRALADHFTAHERWADAAGEWAAVVRAAPGDARAHYELARALGATGKAAEALDELRRAVALDGAAPAYRSALADALWDSEQYYQAINEWRALVAADPGDLHARLRLGRAYLRTGERPLAAREYRRVLEIAPSNQEARRALTQLGAADDRPR